MWRLKSHTGPTASRPIRRTKQLWSSVLLKNTSDMIDQAGIRTHILTTLELESNALDCSATDTPCKYNPPDYVTYLIYRLVNSYVGWQTTVYL